MSVPQLKEDIKEALLGKMEYAGRAINEELLADIRADIQAFWYELRARGDVQGEKPPDFIVKVDEHDPTRIIVKPAIAEEETDSPIRDRNKEAKSPHQIDDWEETMTSAEVDWCWEQFFAALRMGDYGGCTDSFRAARAWKSSQVRRFKRLRSCCGSQEWTAYRWNEEKARYDKYLLGFNYGH
jgi:hypothetical protein